VVGDSAAASVAGVGAGENPMKVGIAREGPFVSPHFGHCEGYTIFSVEEGSIAQRVDIPNPGHQPGILPALLAQEGVNLVIAGGMGPKAIDLFHQHGIEVCIGIDGEIEAVIKAYLQGALRPGESTCHHSDH
jgi:predicted Fe-Mo cluster-binding NifX family protein